jgi:L-asparaginase II
MARFATAADTTARGSAQRQLVAAMTTYPEMVDGEGGCCTGLMRAAGGRVVVKTGAEGVMVGVLPELELGIALKVADGAARASECAITALLVRLGVLDPQDPAVCRWLTPDIRNRRNLIAGGIRPGPGLLPN